LPDPGRLPGRVGDQCRGCGLSSTNWLATTAPAVERTAGLKKPPWNGCDSCGRDCRQLTLRHEDLSGTAQHRRRHHGHRSRDECSQSLSSILVGSQRLKSAEVPSLSCPERTPRQPSGPWPRGGQGHTRALPEKRIRASCLMRSTECGVGVPN